MPHKPKRPCSHSGCPALVEIGTGFCPKHQKEENQRYARTRPTSAQKGYGSKWQTYRKWYLGNHPYCINANNPDMPNCDVIATEIDHIIPSKGPDDPNHWDPNNHRPMCKRCHSSKTAKKDGRWGKTK